MLEPDDFCLCGERRDQLRLYCGCGQPTFSSYVTPSSHELQLRSRADEVPQTATNGAEPDD
jgi:hypothetical protein